MTTATTRPPARAGQFYPGDPITMNRAVDGYLSTGAPASVIGRARRWARAVMLPHAGWVYCGPTIGKTLGRIQMQDTVIILGPRHTPYGANWSIAPQEQWDLPGGSVPIASDLVSKITRLLPEMSPEPEAHRMEHGSEVLLPFLQRMNPKIRAVPIVLGQASYAQTTRIADALAQVLDESREPILLVISSDMNHFDTDAENRRLDTLALQAMTTGDPRRLAQVVSDNDISMCGVIPAVTVMQALQRRTPRIEPELVDYTTSARASGDTSRVVGYAGVVIE
jgi:AmmeMemoRadiSam system protein B